MKVLILSDLHGNLEATQSMLNSLRDNAIKAVILLGDLIDYGPHSNEVIRLVKGLPYPILCNIRGNHEQAILEEEYDRFSSERGRISARYTRSILNQESWKYLMHEMAGCGKQEFEVAGKKCLAVHGSLSDEYWRSITPESDLSGYSAYDYVFSGHSHLPHLFSRYYPVDNPAMRNKKKTTFLNPGSVGQPRNLNPNAQYAIWDTETDEFILASVPYDIKKEQEAFSKEVDPFYSSRLERGI